jgi:LAS superfamily LD-carboxypeptidase LdcB
VDGTEAQTEKGIQVDQMLKQLTSHIFKTLKKSVLRTKRHRVPLFPLVMVMVMVMILVYAMALVASPGFAGQSPVGSGSLVLVNQTHPLHPEDEPATLLDLTGQVRTARWGIQLRKDAGEALISMFARMEDLGDSSAIVLSGYRDYAHQASVFHDYMQQALASGMSYAEAYESVHLRVAFPGESEHQTGLGVDIGSLLGGALEDFHLTPTGRWLQAHGAEHGFILRYPADKIQWTGVMFEPWHFRYVGWPHAEIMNAQNWILEEYLAVLSMSHYLEATLQSGEVVRVVSRSRQDQLPQGYETLSPDNLGNWVGTYSKGVWLENSAPSIWMDHEKTLDPGTLAEQVSAFRVLDRIDFGRMLWSCFEQQIKAGQGTSILGYEGWMVFQQSDVKVVLSRVPDSLVLNGRPAALKLEGPLKLRGVVVKSIEFESPGNEDPKE